MSLKSQQSRRVEAYYNSRAGTIDGLCGAFKLDSITEIIKLLSHYDISLLNGTVCDLGGGNGAASVKIKSHYPSVDFRLADISKPLLKEGEEKFSIKTECVDLAKTLPFSDNSFNMTMALFVINMIEDQEKFVHEMVRTTKSYDKDTKSPGILAISFRAVTTKRENKGVTIYPVSEDAIKECLIEAGCNILDTVKAGNGSDILIIANKL